MSALVARSGALPRALQDFAQAVTEARKAFDAERDMAAWLVFYEAKQTAYTKLVAALPQVEAIESFWRYVQNMAPAAWLPIIEDEILPRSKHLCTSCGAVAVTWPDERRCAQCQKARRLETYQKAKQRARVKQRMRKCPVCKVKPLNPRGRVCLSCQKASRRARNRRYQKSLKDGSVRRVQPRFTREGMSTLARNHITGQPRQTVDSKGVLPAGAIAGPVAAKQQPFPRPRRRSDES
jgi:hypothetical protein